MYLQVEAAKAELEKLQKANQSRQSEIKDVCNIEGENPLIIILTRRTL